MKKILVTGGCGFIGSTVCRHLLKSGYEVVVIDNLSTGRKDNLPEGIECHVEDINESEHLVQIISEVDACIHLAAIASVEICSKDWLKANDTNLRAILRLFEAIRNTHRNKPIPVIYASSAAVYGNYEIMPLKEEIAFHPISGYGADKAACEMFAKVAYESYKIPSVGLRFFNVYGPRQPDKRSMYSGVISKFMLQATHQQPITIYGDGSQQRDFVHVDDVARAILTSLIHSKKTSQVYNVCTGNVVSVKQIAELIQQMAKENIAINYFDKSAYDINISIGDPNKASAELGFEANTNFKTGLQSLWDFYSKTKV